MEGGRFAGSVWDLLRPFPLLMCLVLLLGYLTLCAAWLVFGTSGLVRVHAQLASAAIDLKEIAN